MRLRASYWSSKIARHAHSTSSSKQFIAIRFILEADRIKVNKDKRCLTANALLKCVMNFVMPFPTMLAMCTKGP